MCIKNISILDDFGGGFIISAGANMLNNTVNLRWQVFKRMTV